MISRPFSSLPEAIPLEEESSPEDLKKDTVEYLLTHRDDVERLMKMERRSNLLEPNNRWFPYMDRFRCGAEDLSSEEVLEAVGTIMSDERKQRLKKVIMHRSYSLCLVVEGLSDFGNVSATFRSADALGVQSVHVVSCDSSKR